MGALWGFLPEAYAAISVSAVNALLRLKKGPTPVVVLQNCVTDAGANQLAEAFQNYGKKAELVAIELPHNPQLSARGLDPIVEVALHKDSTISELDVSYNPQFGNTVVAVL